MSQCLKFECVTLTSTRSTTKYLYLSRFIAFVYVLSLSSRWSKQKYHLKRTTVISKIHATKVSEYFYSAEVLYDNALLPRQRGCWRNSRSYYYKSTDKSTADMTAYVYENSEWCCRARCMHEKRIAGYRRSNTALEHACSPFSASLYHTFIPLTTRSPIENISSPPFFISRRRLSHSILL